MGHSINRVSPMPSPMAQSAGVCPEEHGCYVRNLIGRVHGDALYRHIERRTNGVPQFSPSRVGLGCRPGSCPDHGSPGQRTAPTMNYDLGIPREIRTRLVYDSDQL